MAVFIHHGSSPRRTRSAYVDAVKTGAAATRAAAPRAKTKDCGCGGRTKDASPRDVGAPVNEQWMKLDKLMPNDLEDAAASKGVKAGPNKTDIIMAILRAEFTAAQIDAWASSY